MSNALENKFTLNAPKFVIAIILVIIGAMGAAGWHMQGDNLFFALIQSGLAWCL